MIAFFWRMMVGSLTDIAPGDDGREPNWCALREELLMVEGPMQSV